MHKVGVRGPHSEYLLDLVILLPISGFLYLLHNVLEENPHRPYYFITSFSFLTLIFLLGKSELFLPGALLQ